MEILGIGPSELIFIIIIAIIILGPKDMQKAGKTVGRWLKQIIESDLWKAMQQATMEIRRLPTKLMKEANLDEAIQTGRDIQNSISPQRSLSTSSSNRNPISVKGPESSPQSSGDADEIKNVSEHDTDTEFK